MVYSILGNDKLTEAQFNEKIAEMRFKTLCIKLDTMIDLMKYLKERVESNK